MLPLKLHLQIGRIRRCAFQTISHKLTWNPPVAAEGSSRSLFYLQTLRKHREILAIGCSYCSLPEEQNQTQTISGRVAKRQKCTVKAKKYQQNGKYLNFT